MGASSYTASEGSFSLVDPEDVCRALSGALILLLLLCRGALYTFGYLWFLVLVTQGILHFVTVAHCYRAGRVAEARACSEFTAAADRPKLCGQGLVDSCNWWPPTSSEPRRLQRRKRDKQEYMNRRRSLGKAKKHSCCRTRRKRRSQKEAQAESKAESFAGQSVNDGPFACPHHSTSSGFFWSLRFREFRLLF